MSSDPTVTVAVDKPSSILLLSPSLELARAFLSGFFAHCGLPPPESVPSLDWASRARWPISNKYYETEVDFILRQVIANDGQIEPVIEDDDEELQDDDAESGYPAVLYLVPAAQLKAASPFHIPQQVKAAFVEEKPDVSLAFAYAEGGASQAVDEECEETMLEAFLNLGVEFISVASAASSGLDEDHTPPPFEQIVQSLSSHMWPSLTLKSSPERSGPDSAPRASDTISALAGLLGGMGSFGLPPGVDREEGTDGSAVDDSDFSDDDQSFDAGYAALDGSNNDGDETDFGAFETAPSLDGEHRQAGLELRTALASSSRAGEPADDDSSTKPAKWETFDASSSAALFTTAQPVRSDSMLDSFGPPTNSTLSPSNSHPPERKFSSSFAPSPTSPPAQARKDEDPTAHLGDILSHLSSLRAELAGVEDDDERRRRAAAAVMALFGDDFDGLDEP